MTSATNPHLEVSPFVRQVFDALRQARDNYEGSDRAFARMNGIHPSSWSRLKTGELEVISKDEWKRIGQLYNLIENENWKTARTLVYSAMEDSFQKCQDYSKSMVMADDCGIGKSYCARILVRKMKNAFYVDCSQCETAQLFIRTLARTIGVDSNGRFADVRERLRFGLIKMNKPLIVLDDAGYLRNSAFIEIIGLWNASEGKCGWYMIGDDSLEFKIQRGLSNKRIGYRAIFNRFSEEYIHLIPPGKEDRDAYMLKLLDDVAKVNLKKKSDSIKYAKKCFGQGKNLRTLKTLVEWNG